MIPLKRRSRMISLRVSEEEYAGLMQVYRSHGARSLSDFARLAMVRVAGFENAPSDLHARLEELSTRIEVLESRFDRIAPDRRS